MGLLWAFWDYLVMTSPYLLLGLVSSGLIREFLNIEMITKHLAGSGPWPIVKASLFGIPLPLCSCSVVPAAVTLRKQGASISATSSFLISTPESGVDSIAMTYGVMDLPMTIVRPIAAFITATLAGFGQMLFNKEFEVKEVIDEKKQCCDHGHDHENGKEKKVKFKFRISNVFSFAFGKLSDDIAMWLFIGLVVGAMMNYFLPEDLFTQIPTWGSRLLVLGIGIPFYICASASTPIAASMMLKGMSPGTALIFLLVGPATNFTNIAVIHPYIGKKGVLINVIAISLVALGLSYVVDFLYSNFDWPMSFKVEHVHDHQTGIFENLIACFLLILLIKGIYIEKVRPYMNSRKVKDCCS